MPELPEVETIVRYLRQDRAHKILGARFINFWTDFPKNIKKPKSTVRFKKEIIGRKIENIRRRGKNILFDLSGRKTLLIHQKMTGHLLIGKWQRTNSKEQGVKDKWQPVEEGPLADPVNRFIHMMLWLDSGQMLALSDLRKFAKVELWDAERMKESDGFSKLGPEPLEKSFTLERFREVLRKKSGKIKQTLMDQETIAGVGNIYSDEILWTAKISPFKENKKISGKEIKRMYGALKRVLSSAVELKGDSMQDYRLPSGEKGGYQNVQKVYGREGKPCKRLDGGIIKRVKIGGRSAHFCPRCQK